MCKIASNLQLALEEMEEAHTQGSAKSDGIRQMTSMISGLSNEKREYFQKFELAAADLKLVQEELEELKGKEETCHVTWCMVHGAWCMVHGAF